jgi:hypothetical protein
MSKKETGVQNTNQQNLIDLGFEEIQVEKVAIYGKFPTGVHAVELVEIRFEDTEVNENAKGDTLAFVWRGEDTSKTHKPVCETVVTVGDCQLLFDDSCTEITETDVNAFGKGKGENSQHRFLLLADYLRSMQVATEKEVPEIKNKKSEIYETMAERGERVLKALIIGAVKLYNQDLEAGGEQAEQANPVKSLKYLLEAALDGKVKGVKLRRKVKMLFVQARSSSGELYATHFNRNLNLYKGKRPIQNNVMMTDFVEGSWLAYDAKRHDAKEEEAPALTPDGGFPTF